MSLRDLTGSHEEITKPRRSHKARQVDIPIQYDGIVFDEGLRLDILVEAKVVIEVKALESVNPVWVAQVLSQLKLTGLRLGYLINFNTPTIKEGVRRIVL